MQTYFNQADQSVWEFEDDVKDIFAFPSTPTECKPVTQSDRERILAAVSRKDAIKSVGSAWVITPRAVTPEDADAARHKRDALLKACDYMAMPDYPLPIDDAAELREYRQRLRDITEQPKFPAEIIWPSKPEFIK